MSIRLNTCLRNSASVGHGDGLYRSMRTSPEYTRGMGQNTVGDTMPYLRTFPKNRILALGTP